MSTACVEATKPGCLQGCGRTLPTYMHRAVWPRSRLERGAPRPAAHTAHAPPGRLAMANGRRPPPPAMTEWLRLLAPAGASAPTRSAPTAAAVPARTVTKMWGLSAAGRKSRPPPRPPLNHPPSSIPPPAALGRCRPSPPPTPAPPPPSILHTGTHTDCGAPTPTGTRQGRGDCTAAKGGRATGRGGGHRNTKSVSLPLCRCPQCDGSRPRAAPLAAIRCRRRRSR